MRARWTPGKSAFAPNVRVVVPQGLLPGLLLQRLRPKTWKNHPERGPGVPPTPKSLPPRAYLGVVGAYLGVIGAYVGVIRAYVEVIGAYVELYRAYVEL